MMNKMKHTVADFKELKILRSLIVLITALGLYANTASAQESETYSVGDPLGLTSNGEFQPISSNVSVYGAIQSAESCIYDAERELIVVPSMGDRQNVQVNDDWDWLINCDGPVRTTKRIGVQNSNQRSDLNPPLVLNEPLGSEIADGVLYLADRDGGTSRDDPSTAVIRRFDLETGEPLEDIRIEESPWINDITVAVDGTIYTTQTGDIGPDGDPQSWKVWKISPEGSISEFVVGDPINAPNGIAIDPDGNIVVVNFGNPDVLTFSPDGELLKTEQAVQAGGDGIEIMPDGTKYISSVRQGGISRIRPGESAELIAENIPSAASICYDSDTNQLVVPMTSQSTLGFISLD